MGTFYGSTLSEVTRDCTMLGPSTRGVGLIDITQATDAPRRIATFRHATLRVATHRYANA